MPEQEYLVVEHLSIKDIKRIFSKIRVDKAKGCWIWIAGCDSVGYGIAYYHNRAEKAHRFMYAYLVDPIPRIRPKTPRTGIPELDHVVCQNPRCCNPAHLELVPHRINVLRGTSPVASRAQQTVCKHGHPFDRQIGNARACSTCQRNRAQRRRYGPDREAFLQKSREWNRRYKEHLSSDPNRAEALVRHRRKRCEQAKRRKQRKRLERSGLKQKTTPHKES